MQKIAIAALLSTFVAVPAIASDFSSALQLAQQDVAAAVAAVSNVATARLNSAGSSATPLQEFCL